MAAGDGGTPFVDYHDYKKDPENFVWVKVETKGLKKKFMQNAAANGEVEFTPGDRSFNLSVTVDPDRKARKYVYNVKRLPEPIDPDKSHHKIRDNAVELYLAKLNSGSWARHLGKDGRGLETAD